MAKIIEYNPENVFKPIYITEEDINNGARAILEGFLESETLPQEKKTVGVFHMCAKKAEEAALNELPLMMRYEESIESIDGKSIDKRKGD